MQRLTIPRYLKWDSSVPVSQSAYLTNTCNDNRNSDNETPTIVGEFSLSVPDEVQWSSAWDPSTQQAFYSQWFAAQVTKYEQAKLPVECHLYAKGGHGFTMGARSKLASIHTWTQRLADWLADSALLVKPDEAPKP